MGKRELKTPPEDIFAYSLNFYDDHSVFRSLKDLYNKQINFRSPNDDNNETYLGICHCESGDSYYIYYTDKLFKTREVTNNEILEIQKSIDSEIKKTKDLLDELFNNRQGTITGYFGLMEEDREKAIEKSIYNKSHEIKKFEELDPEKFKYVLENGN